MNNHEICKQCGGSGETFFNVSPYLDHPIYELVTCPTCRGRGYITDDIFESTENEALNKLRNDALKM